MHAFNPQWTVGGPLDQSTISFSAKEQRILGLFQTAKKHVRFYFKPLRRLVERYPDSPFLLVRLAVGHLYLDDILGALELFEEAHALLHDKDTTFNQYLSVLRDFVKKNIEEEDREWSQPEGSFIVSKHIPPQPLSSYSFKSVSDDNVRTSWKTLLSEDRRDFTAERYSRLLAVESNEIENVFHLAGDSLVRLVRVGFYTAAIDRVLELPSGKPDPSTVVDILRDFAQALTIFTEMVRSSPAVTTQHICQLHAQVVKVNMISTVVIDGIKFDYFVPPGVYRRRITTTTLSHTEGFVQFAKWQSIPEEMSSFVSQLMDCLSSNASPFVKAAWIHSTFVGIHPFADGNGRVARIIASIPLIQIGLPFINVRQALREEYMKAVSTAGMTFDLQPLAKLFVKSMEESIQYVASLPPPSPEDKQWAQSSTSGSTQISV